MMTDTAAPLEPALVLTEGEALLSKETTARLLDMDLRELERMTRLYPETFPQPYPIAPRKWRYKLSDVRGYMLRLRANAEDHSEPKPKIKRLRRIPSPPRRHHS